MYSMYYSLIIFSCIVCKMHVFDARIKDCLYYMGVVCIGLFRYVPSLLLFLIYQFLKNMISLFLVRAAHFVADAVLVFFASKF